MKPTDPAGQAGQTDVFSSETALFSESFSTILDETCRQLETIRNQGALKRIRRLEAILDTLEDALNPVVEPP